MNPTKSEFVVVTNKIVVYRPQLFICSDPMKEVDSFKYLDIHVNTRLKINVKINHSKGKLSQLCGVSCRLSKFLDFQSPKNKYNLCIYSVLSYCKGVWGGVSQCTSRCDISRIHRKIVKNLFSKFFINSHCIFRETRFLKIDEIYKLSADSYMYIILKHNKYPTSRSSLHISYPGHNYRTRNNNDMLLPYQRVEAIWINFRYQFVKVWRGVPYISNDNEDAQVLRMA